MIQMILKKLIKKTCKPARGSQSRYVEDILYPTQVYPIYLCVQQKFNFCIKNRLMKREDILYMKEMLNSFIRNPKIYQNKKYANDINEIYSKLKNHYIKAKEMQKLLDFVNQFVVDIPETIQTVNHLRVIK